VRDDWIDGVMMRGDDEGGYEGRYGGRYDGDGSRSG